MSASITAKSLTYRSAGQTPSFTTFNIALPPRANEIVVRIKAAALNPVDLKLHNSNLVNFLSWKDKGIGRDFSGVVEHVGSNVKAFVVGDRVCGMVRQVRGHGSLSSHMVFDVNGSDIVFKAPNSLTDEEAAAFPLTFGTAYQCIQKAKLSKTSRVAVLGGSTGCGIFAIQLLKQHFGAEFVVATCSPSSKALVESLGADHIIDYRSQSVPDALQELTKEGKFDLILDTVGGSDVLSVASNLLTPQSDGSAYTTIVGDLSHGYDRPVGSYLGIFKTLLRPHIGYFTGVNYSLELTERGDWCKSEINNPLFDSGKIKVVIDQSKNWKDWNVQFEKLMSKKAHGKLVLTIDDSA